MLSRANPRPLIMISLFCAVIGLIVAGLMRGWIIIQLPAHTGLVATPNSTQEKSCVLWFFSQQGWKSEKKVCVWPEDTAQALEHLVSSWLTVLEEEGVLKAPIKLTAALVSPEQRAYLSFNRSPFAHEDSLQTHWFFVEGLLKTLRLHIPDIRQVMLLVNNHPLINRHFDFQNPWPIQGFLDNTTT